MPAGGDDAVTHAVLLPSPFLPAVAYGPLVDALGRHGWGVVVATTASPPVGPQDVLTAYGACVTKERADNLFATKDGWPKTIAFLKQAMK